MSKDRAWRTELGHTQVRLCSVPTSGYHQAPNLPAKPYSSVLPFLSLSWHRKWKQDLSNTHLYLDLKFGCKSCLRQQLLHSSPHCCLHSCVPAGLQTFSQYKTPWCSSCVKERHSQQPWESSIQTRVRAGPPEGPKVLRAAMFPLWGLLGQFPSKWILDKEHPKKAHPKHLRACREVPCLCLYPKMFLFLRYLGPYDSFLLSLALWVVQGRAWGARSSLGPSLSTDWPKTMLKAVALTHVQPAAGKEEKGEATISQHDGSTSAQS